MVETNAIVGNKNVSDKPWEVLNVTDINKYRMDQAPAPPAGMFNMLDVMRGAYDTISGIHDSTRGAKTPGMDKVGIVSQLKQSDFTRLSLLVKSLERAISEVGEMCISRVLQHERLHKIYYFVDKDTNQFNTLEFDGFPEEVDLFIKVEVTAGSTLPKDKQSLAALALQLFSQGVIGQRYLLDTLELPNKEKALEETDMLRQQQEQIQQQEQQMKGS